MKTKLLIFLTKIKSLFTLGKKEILKKDLTEDENLTFFEGKPFNGVCVDSHDNGKKEFDIKISELLQHNTPYVLYAKGIEKGQIFNHEGQPIIIELEGNGGRINTRQKSISITQNAQAVIHPTTSDQTLHVSSNAFKYNHDKKESQFYNQTTLIVNDTTITSPEFNYSNNDEQLVFPKGFNLSAKNSITDTTYAILNINTATITASNNVKTV